MKPSHILSFTALVVWLTCCTQKPDEKHLRLRNQTAINYFSAKSHLRLARYYYDKGEKVQAFFIAEEARKMFGDKEFTPAFKKVAAVAFTESTPEQIALFDEQIQLASNDKNVEESLDRLLSQYPKHWRLMAVAAKYYLKVKNDPYKAMPLYIDLYFHDPHFYDWEYAEYRVKQMTSSLKAHWWARLKNSGKPYAEIAADEKNPRALDGLVDEVNFSWDPSYVPAMEKLLDNDDVYLQKKGLHALLNHPADFKDDRKINSLLNSADLVKRAMASFLVVKNMPDSKIEMLKDNLNSGIELIQLDTMQALTIAGEEGRAFLKANRPAKMSSAMTSFWEQAEKTGFMPPTGAGQ